MSLDVYLEVTQPVDVFSANITHNLRDMAKEAGIHEHLWVPENLGITRAKDLIAPLRSGIHKMKADPERFKKYDAHNGWGLYHQFLPWLERYLEACIEYPNAEVRVSR